MGQAGPFGFSGGLISNASVFNQPKNTTYTQKGYRYIQGSIKEVFGSSQINATQMAGTGAHLTTGILKNLYGPGNFPLLAVTDGKFYTVDGTGAINDVSGVAALTVTNSAPTVADFLNGIMVISDASGTTGWLGQWTGAGNVTKLTVAPDASIVKTVNNFMFAVTPNSSNISWSNASDPGTWTAANNINFRKNDGDSISALSFIGTDLYIFKKFSIGRLSTVTTSASGAVTLAPLTTVNVGVGCAGALAIDRLPDGRLIFLGSDFHAYIFDGSVLRDISDQPLPQSNVQTIFDTAAPATVNTGVIQLLSVCVYPVRHECWFVISPNPLTVTSVGSNVMIYDYLNNVWSQLDFTGGVTYMGYLSYIPNYGGNAKTFTSLTSTYGATGDLVNGLLGYLYLQDISNGTSRPSVYQWNASIELSGEGKKFIPRSLLLFHKGTSATTTFAVTYAWDGGTLGNSTTITTSTSFIRTIIPLKTPVLGQSSTGPSSLQIQILDSNGGGITFDPFYLSDEVMN